MQRLVCGFMVGLALTVATTASAQSLFLLDGERAVEASAGWSVGPFSNGIETHLGGSLDGRWDVAIAFNHYAADFGGEDDTTFTEWSPSVRYLLLKEVDDSMPVSFIAHAAYFRDHYDGDIQSWYALLGGQLVKRFDVTNAVAFYPYVGFSLAGESNAFSGAEAERSVYLTRQVGVHTVFALGTDSWVRLTIEEHGFRRETYRAARVAIVRRF